MCKCNCSRHLIVDFIYVDEFDDGFQDVIRVIHLFKIKFSLFAFKIMTEKWNFGRKPLAAILNNFKQILDDVKMLADCL